MMKPLFLLSLAASLALPSLQAEIQLPKLLSDGGVLQREKAIPVYGWADASEELTIQLADQSIKVLADPTGYFEVDFKALPAGGPYQLTVASEDESVTVSGLLVGDVWVCSGQSNMETPMNRVVDLFADELANSDNPNIRAFNVPTGLEFNHPWQDISGGEWKVSSPENNYNLSAIAYFFAKEIEQEQGVPVGIVINAVGGSPIEAWLSEENLADNPIALKLAAPYKDQAYIDAVKAEEQAAGNAWYGTRDREDIGMHAEVPYYAAELDTSDWQEVMAPGLIKDHGVDLGDGAGVVWLSKEVELPESLAGKEALLRLGTLIDADVAWVNGEKVGETGYMYPPRKYPVPEGLLKAGKNRIAVRLTCNSSRGGFVDDKRYELEFDDSSISLEGAWKAKITYRCGPPPSSTFFRWKPTVLYNTKMAPLSKSPIAGILWYQGESNTGRTAIYEAQMSTLVAQSRLDWGQPDLPFLAVQLANFMAPSDVPQESGWAEIREAQRLAAASDPNVGLAVILDTGEWNDIHPLDKKTVAQRLALQARKIAYGEDVVADGPLFKCLKKKGSKLVVSFTSVADGLVVEGDEPLANFAIAGKDGVYHWAKAKIKGDSVVLSCKEVSDPVSVRYAWAHNPEGSKLYNSAGLPASSFEAKVEE